VSGETGGRVIRIVGHDVGVSPRDSAAKPGVTRRPLPSIRWGARVARHRAFISREFRRPIGNYWVVLANIGSPIGPIYGAQGRLNRLCGKVEAYLAEAQRLTHTGELGLRITSGKVKGTTRAHYVYLDWIPAAERPAPNSKSPDN